jgi:PAS domain S-box-containing protein
MIRWGHAAKSARERAVLGARAFGRSFPPWVSSACLAVVVAISYFLAARLSLALLTNPDGVAVFWPAAGISAGVLIGLGPKARLSVIVGVIAATIAANLLGDRNVPSSIVFAACNAFEAVLVAGLIERYVGLPFRLDNLRRVLELVAAAIIGATVSGIGGMVGYLLFHQSATPNLIILYHWLASDAIGIITVAPFVISLVRITSDPPSLRESVEGTAALLMLAAVNLLFVFVPRAPWNDVALVSIFPLLLWIAARLMACFIAAAQFIIAVAIVWMTIFEIGVFGDKSIPIDDRVLTAQAVILALSLCALVLGALFVERREVEARLQAALRTGRAVAFEWDFRNGFLQLSENSAQLLGLSRRQTAASFMEQIHADDRLRVSACVCDLHPNNPVYTLNYRYLRPDGEQIWIESTGRAEFDEAGQILRIRGLRVDVTKHMQIEEELASARKIAEEASRAKSAFLAAASHDLRQPLQAMRILQGTLAHQIHDNVARKSIVSIGHSLETMTDMLTSLLDINQLEAGNLRPSISDFPINDIFDALAADFREPATEKGLRWRWVRSRITVQSDQRMLREMIRNLLSNAIRYTDRGSILVGCRRAGDEVRIEVWDSGVGIMGEEMPRIFEEHFQAPQHTQLGGFGLGLAIVQRLGNILGHRIAARSTPGKGSVFSIEVPMGHEQAKAGIRPELPPDRSIAHVSGTILLIEDEGSVRDALKSWLRSEGLGAISVANGTEALALITERRVRPDLILSDYNIPGSLNGIESVHALREALTWKIPAIILTGDTRSLVIEAIAKHDVAIAVKPMKADQLKELIVTLLGGSKAV